MPVNNNSSTPLNACVPLETQRRIAQQQQQQQGSGSMPPAPGINTGPSSDSFNTSNIFAGSQPSDAPKAENPSPSPAAAPETPAETPTGNAPTDSPGENPGEAPTPTASGNAPMGSPDENSGATPTPAGGTNGGNSAYANNMLDTLKKMNAPDSLIDAYKKQYEALGMLPSSGGGAPTPAAGGGTPTNGETPSTPTPTGGDSPTGDGAPTPSAGDTPTPTASGDSPTPSAGGTPTQTGGDTPTPSGDSTTMPTDGETPATPTPTGGDTPTPSGGATPTPSGSDAPTPSGGGGEGGGGKIQWDKAPENLKKLQPAIENASKATGTPEDIIAGVIWQESGGNPDVGGGAQGLMQIDPNSYNASVAGKHGLPSGSVPRDPDGNIMAGAEFLGQMKQKFGSWDLALRGYNSGENGVDRNNPNSIPAGTGDPNYITHVNDHIKNLEAGTPLQNRG
jgi:hypothetical protein